LSLCISIKEDAHADHKLPVAPLLKQVDRSLPPGMSTNNLIKPGELADTKVTKGFAMNTTAARILCIEPELTLETRCAVLKRHGYEALAAPISLAQTLLASQTYDLIILSAMLPGEERRRVAIAARSMQILILDEPTMPSDLVAQVAERLQPAKGRIA
jgi:hypothetical protein